MKRTIAGLMVIGWLSIAAIAQRTTFDAAVITVSGTATPKFYNTAGAMSGTFSEQIAGSPSTVSIVIQGCSRSGVCKTLETNTTVADDLRTPTIANVYDYFVVTPSWTGGTNVSVTITPTLGPATSGSVGSGGTSNQGTPNTVGNSWPVEQTDGTNVLGTSSHPQRVDPTGTTTQPVSAASLPLPSGAATSAKQPALGTAGTPSADVLSVQGITSMTPLKTDPSGVTSPVSVASLPLPSGASTAAKQPALGTAGTPSADVLSVQGVTSMTPLKTDPSGVTSPVSVASLPLPSGASTAAKQPALGTAGTPAADVITVQGASGMTPLSVKSTDGTNTAVIDPCRGQTKSFVSISQTANTKLVTGTSAKKIYICAIDVVVAAATNVALVEGTGTVCATNTVQVSGFPGTGTAATGWNFAANGGIAKGSGDSSLGAESVNADDLCLFNSGSGQVSGGIAYVVQ